VNQPPKVKIRRIQGLIALVYALSYIPLFFVGEKIAVILAVLLYFGGILYSRHVAYVKNRDHNGWTLLALFNPIVVLFILSMLKILPEEAHVS
jgi:uncharacterized membrane protein HdeD (DUF308 family)